MHKKSIKLKKDKVILLFNSLKVVESMEAGIDTTLV